MRRKWLDNREERRGRLESGKIYSRITHRQNMCVPSLTEWVKGEEGKNYRKCK